MNTQQLKAIRAIADAIVDSVKAAGEFGAPSGVVYAALMGHMRLDQYEQFISALVNAGKLRKDGNLLYAI